MNEHTLYLAEGRWQISGSTVDVAGNPNIAIGYAVVSRSGELWVVEEQVNELQNRFGAGGELSSWAPHQESGPGENPKRPSGDATSP